MLVHQRVSETTDLWLAGHVLGRYKFRGPRTGKHPWNHREIDIFWCWCKTKQKHGRYCCEFYFSIYFHLWRTKKSDQCMDAPGGLSTLDPLDPSTIPWIRFVAYQQKGYGKSLENPPKTWHPWKIPPALGASWIPQANTGDREKPPNECWKARKNIGPFVSDMLKLINHERSCDVPILWP